MPKITFLELAEKILREQGKPLSPTEIWEIAVSNGYENDIESCGKTPARTLYSSILYSTRNNKNIFVKVQQKPAKYFLKELHDGLIERQPVRF